MSLKINFLCCITPSLMKRVDICLVCSTIFMSIKNIEKLCFSFLISKFIYFEFQKFDTIKDLCVGETCNKCSAWYGILYDSKKKINSKHQQQEALMQIIPWNYWILLTQHKIWIQKNVHIVFSNAFVAMSNAIVSSTVESWD